MYVPISCGFEDILTSLVSKCLWTRIWLALSSLQRLKFHVTFLPISFRFLWGSFLAHLKVPDPSELTPTNLNGSHALDSFFHLLY